MSEQKGYLPLLHRESLPPRKPERVQPNERLSASKTNQTVDAVRRSYGVVKPPAEVPFVQTQAPVEIQQFKVREELVGTDCVVCERHAGPPRIAGADDVVLVALPHQLRRTPFDTGTSAPTTTGQARDGISYAYTSNTERTATDADDNDEDQEIIPGYVEGDIIYALRQEGVGVGVYVTYATGVKVELEWLDLNLDARAWCEV